MPRMLLALTLALLVSISLSVGVASASHTSEGGGPNKNLVSGTGKDSTRNGTDFYLHVKAHSGPEGENSRGHFALRSVGPVLNIDATGEVVCLGVRGNRAALAGIVERNKKERPDPVKVVYLWVEDNGEGKGATDKFDFVAFSFPGPPPPPPDEEVCRRLGESLLTFPLPGAGPGPVINQGNFMVHDVTP
jgi:hypothetical protein